MARLQPRRELEKRVSVRTQSGDLFSIPVIITFVSSKMFFETTIDKHTVVDPNCDLKSQPMFCLRRTQERH